MDKLLDLYFDQNYDQRENNELVTRLKTLHDLIRFFNERLSAVERAEDSSDINDADFIFKRVHFDFHSKEGRLPRSTLPYEAETFNLQAMSNRASPNLT